MYYVINCDEDGEVSVRSYKKEELLTMLKEGQYGHAKFIDKLEESDPQCWGYNTLIIKGEILIPKPIKVVEEYEI